MTRSQALTLLPCLAITIMSGCTGCGNDDPRGRPVATPSDKLDSAAWGLAQDRWAELIEKTKARIPEALEGREKNSGGKVTLTVEIKNEGFPSEARVFDRPNLPDKVALATVELKIVEKVDKKDTRDLDYIVTYVWNRNRWEFFEATATLVKSTLPETGGGLVGGVGQTAMIEDVKSDVNLVWLFGPPLSKKANAPPGL